MHITHRVNDRAQLAIAVLVLAALAVALLSFRSSESAGAATQSTIMCDSGTGTGTPGDPVQFDLTAEGVYIQMPDGAPVYMWSYRSTTGASQFPGPNMCVTAGNSVRVTLTNNLSYQATATSIVFPGQTGVSVDPADAGVAGLFTSEAVQGGTVSYEFVATEPGTYLYESGTDQVRQVAMGLFGGLVIRPDTAGSQVYNDADTAFDPNFEYLLLFHEIDPVLHDLVDTGGDIATWDPTTKHNRYWTINGRAFPDVIAPNNAPYLPTQPYGGLVQVQADLANPALVRYANAGLDNHPFHPHGDHLHIVGQDGRSLGTNAGDGVLDGAVESYSKTVAAGASYELLANWQNVDVWNAPGEPVPVTIPGMENLVFKDGVTFYSGDPKLGETGEFASGITTYTECGEYYFPWHSHALNETQNFDQGFGGMFTLWRVDPPGGC